MPTSAAREPSTIGEKPARFTSEGAPRPSTAASGMPWMLPVGLVSAVFASAWASNQTRPSFSFRRWKCRARPAIVPIATEWSPPSTTGVAPAPSASPTRSRSVSQTSRISFRYLRRGSPGPCVSGIFTCRSPRSSTSWPSCGDLRVHLRHAERRGAHVDAAAAGAEVEGHADEGHASLRHARSFRGNVDTVARPRTALNAARADARVRVDARRSGSDNPARAAPWRSLRRGRPRPRPACRGRRTFSPCSSRRRS